MIEWMLVLCMTESKACQPTKNIFPTEQACRAAVANSLPVDWMHPDCKPMDKGELVR